MRSHDPHFQALGLFETLTDSAPVIVCREFVKRECRRMRLVEVTPAIARLQIRVIIGLAVLVAPPFTGGAFFWFVIHWVLSCSFHWVWRPTRPGHREGIAGTPQRSAKYAV